MDYGIEKMRDKKEERDMKRWKKELSNFSYLQSNRTQYFLDMFSHAFIYNAFPHYTTLRRKNFVFFTTAFAIKIETEIKKFILLCNISELFWN